jgi:SulP family sulfate permease
VVNIRSGGRTQLSGAIRAGVVLLLVLGLAEYVKVIPHAVLAGILIKVGWDIVDWRFVTRLHRVQREHLLVMVLTMGLTVFLDLVTAVAIGLIVAGMASARQWERLELDSVMSVPLLDSVFLTPDDTSDDADIFSARVGLVSMRGSFSVASSGKLTTVITADIRDHEVVILNFSDTVHMDDSAALVIEQLIDVAYDQDTACIIMGLKGRPAVTMQALNVLRRVPREHFVADIDEAREVARRVLA